MDDNLIQIQNVSHFFRSGFWMTQTQVLHDINLTISKGSVFGFLGANGAGKTTLISLMVGIRKPTRGKVLLSGHDVTQTQTRKKIGFLPERPYYPDHLTGQGFLMHFGRLSGLSDFELKAEIPRVLHEVGLEGAQRKELKKYSKGMLQRIGIAQAILHKPDFLVLDEPMSGLDPLGRKEMRELIQNLARQGHTLFFSSHVIPDVEAICNQVAWIHKGKLVGSGPIGEFLSHGPIETEIAFSCAEVGPIKKLQWFKSLEPMPNGWRAIVTSQQNVSNVLAELIKVRADIYWVTPHRQNLEDFFEQLGREVRS